MNLSDLQTKLMDAARKAPVPEAVPYAFEKRIMARLASVSPLNFWALWGRPLWGGALTCVALTVLCGVWSVTAAPPKTAAAPGKAATADSFAQAFERTVLASADQHVEDGW